MRSLSNQTKNMQGWSRLLSAVLNWGFYFQHKTIDTQRLSTGKMSSRYFQLELNLQHGTGGYSQVWFMVGRSKRGLSGCAPDQNRERKQNLSHSLKQAAAFLMYQEIWVNFMQPPWTQTTWWHLFLLRWQQHQLELHLDFPRDARKQLSVQELPASLPVPV